MIQRRSTMCAAAAAALLLAGCDGSSPTPMSSPTPGPTATPAPTPTYAAFPLSAPTQFMAFNGATSYTGNPGTGDISNWRSLAMGVASTENPSSRVGVTLGTQPSTGIFGYSEGNEEARFTAATPVTPSVATNAHYVFRSEDPATPGKFSQIEFLNNTIPGSVTNDALLGSLTRVSYANWWRGDSTLGTKRMSSGVFGYPTQIADMPTSGTISYTTRLRGRRAASCTGMICGSAVFEHDGYALVSVNFSTGGVTLTLFIDNFASINAQGAIAAGSNQFTASFDPIYTISGTITGSFYGPQAGEIGFVYAGGGFLNGANHTYAGAVVGKKQ